MEGPTLTFLRRETDITQEVELGREIAEGSVLLEQGVVTEVDTPLPLLHCSLKKHCPVKTDLFMIYFSHHITNFE